MSTGLQPTASAYMASGCVTGFFVAVALTLQSPSLDLNFSPNPGSRAANSDTALALKAADSPAVMVDEIRVSSEPTPSLASDVVTVRRGDTLLGVMQNAGVAGVEAHALIASLRNVFDPRDIKVGQQVALRTTSQGSATLIDSLRIDTAPGTSVVAFATEAGFESRALIEPTESLPQAFAGIINTSLYDAAVDQGVPPSVLVEMIRLFSYDVDFQRDIRQGDDFELMFDQQITKNGQVVKNDDIAYASMTLRGETLKIYAFTHDNGDVGYYTDQGKGIRKALMRTPINGARLSSSFGARRHPVLGYTKMHKGVDFAAPRGTPIYAAGDGVIEKRLRWGSFGNYIRIRHGDGFSTAYAHMNSFAKGYGVGSRVKQGAVIGYVGTTGRSTGPHLHYEVMKNGAQVNPMKVRFPASKALEGESLEKFQMVRKAADKAWAALAMQADVASLAIEKPVSSVE